MRGLLIRLTDRPLQRALLVGEGSYYRGVILWKYHKSSCLSYRVSQWGKQWISYSQNSRDYDRIFGILIVSIEFSSYSESIFFVSHGPLFLSKMRMISSKLHY